MRIERELNKKAQKYPRDGTGYSVVTGISEYVVVLARLRQCLNMREGEANDGEYIPYLRLLFSQQLFLIGIELVEDRKGAFQMFHALVGMPGVDVQRAERLLEQRIVAGERVNLSELAFFLRCIADTC